MNTRPYLKIHGSYVYKPIAVKRVCGRSCVIFDYFIGETLCSRLARCGRLPFREALYVVDDLLQCLSATHDAGVVHRYINPGVMFLDAAEDGAGRERARIVDLGHAAIDRLNDNESTITSLTAHGAQFGVAGYAPPEVIAGGKPPDEQDDLYALLIVAFQIVTGRLPFPGGAAQPLGAPPPQLTNEFAPADSFFQKGLAPRRSQRFKCAASALFAWRSIFREPPKIITWT